MHEILLQVGGAEWSVPERHGQCRTLAALQILWEAMMPGSAMACPRSSDEGLGPPMPLIAMLLVPHTPCTSTVCSHHL